MADGPVSMVGPSGSIVEVAAADAQLRAAQGWRMATAGDFAAREERDTYGTVGGMALTALEGVAAGATFGGSRALLGGLGYGEDVQKLRAHNAWTSGLGELGGSLVAPGVGGVLGKGAGKALGGGRAARIGGAVLGEAAEGAIEGAGSALGRWSIGDPELAGQSLVGSIGSEALTGGLIGGALGGVLSGGSEALRSYGRRAENALERPGREAVGRTVGDLAGDAPADVVDDVARRTERGTFGNTWDLLKGGGRGADRAVNAETHLARGGERAARASRGLRGVEEAAAGSGLSGARLSRSRLTELVDQSRSARAAEAARGNASLLRSELETLLGEAPAGTRRQLKRMVSRARRAEKAVLEAAESGRPHLAADAFEALDDARADLGRTARRIQGASSSGLEAVGTEKTVRRLQQLQDGIASHLEDSSLYGAAAEAQRRLRAPWAGGAPDLAHGAPEALARALGEADDAQRSTLQRWLDRTDAYVEEARQSLTLDPVQSAQLQEMADHSAELRRAMEGASEVRRARDTYDAVEAASGSSGLLGSVIGMGVAGGLLSGPVGAAAAMIGGAVANPAGLVRRVAGIHSMLGSLEGRLSGGLRSLVHHAPGAAGVGRRVTQAARRRPKSREDREKAHAERTSVAATLSTSPAERERYVSAALGDLTGAVPAIHAAALATVQRREDYLLAVAPKAQTRPFGPSASLSTSELSRFERVRDVLDDPASVVDLMRDRQLRHEQVDAIRAVYPALYRQIQQGAVDELMEAEATDRQIDYGARVQLTTLLGIPAHASLSPAVIAAVQATYADTPQPQIGPSAPSKPNNHAPDLSSDMRTGSERTTDEDDET